MIAILTAILMIVFLSICAFTIDVGHWYVVGEQEQRAADAAALAGVVNLPADPVTAAAVAQSFSRQNGFASAPAVSVQAAVADKPTRLKVTVTSQVDNWFGALLGVPTTPVTRTAVADYAGPVAMGSPCNEFGNDPSTDAVASKNCNGTGNFWANVGSLASQKSYGDAFQDGVCNGADGCTGATNTDYSPNGYFYTVTLAKPIANLTLEAFDPAFVAVGDVCGPASGLNGPVGTLYEPGSASPYCTGDVAYDSPTGSNVGNVQTEFAVRQANALSTPWDPSSYPAIGGCTTDFPGYNQSLANIQNSTWATGDPVKQALKSVFRKWVPLCKILGTTPAGTYYIQVKTNGLGFDRAEGHNRFSLRAYSGLVSADNASISISGNQRMGIYANLPNASTTFHLARIPTSAAGHVLTVRLFDIGDSNVAGVVTVRAPDGSTPSGCTGVGPAPGPLVGCSLVASAIFNGKWQSISVPVPSTYTCTDSDPTACWYKLNYSYGVGSQPSDTTSWTASLEGDPVRLVQ